MARPEREEFVRIRDLVEALIRAGVPFAFNGRSLVLTPSEARQCSTCTSGTRKALAAALGVP